jgi:biopolymer transport protein ExbD
VIEFKKFEEGTDRGGGPDLTPMIDMVFLLLIFFLLTSFLTRSSIPVDLPDSRAARFQEKPDLVVTVLENGDLLLEGKTISDERLGPTLKRMLSSGGESEVVIQSDRRVSFGRVVEVMDAVNSAGAGRISFLVEKKQ